MLYLCNVLKKKFWIICFIILIYILFFDCSIPFIWTMYSVLIWMVYSLSGLNICLDYACTIYLETVLIIYWSAINYLSRSCIHNLCGHCIHYLFVFYMTLLVWMLYELVIMLVNDRALSDCVHEELLLRVRVCLCMYYE